MTLLKEFILPRLVQWIFVIFLGVTITFIIPRLSPVNPVTEALGRMQMYQKYKSRSCGSNAGVLA